MTTQNKREQKKSTLIGMSAVTQGVHLQVYVQPGSSIDKLRGLYQDRYKISLAAPPEKGAANRALVEFFSRLLKIPKTKISVISGELSQHKTLLIETTDPQSLMEQLQLVLNVT